MKQKYLHYLSIQQIAENNVLREKYRLTDTRLELEVILNSINDKIIGLGARKPEQSKKKYKRLRKELTYNFLVENYPDRPQLAECYKVNYLDNNLDYEPLSSREKHIVIHNKCEDWVRTISRKNKNAIDIETETKGIYILHNEEPLFISNNMVHSCEVIEIEKLKNVNYRRSKIYKVKVDKILYPIGRDL